MQGMLTDSAVHRFVLRGLALALLVVWPRLAGAQEPSRTSPPPVTAAPSTAAPARPAPVPGTAAASAQPPKRVYKAFTDVASLRKGSVIQYGVTAGVSLAMHLPSDGKLRTKEPAVSVMPYVGFLPGRLLWPYGRISKRYCAAAFAGEEAQSIANDVARDLAAEAKENPVPVQEPVTVEGGVEKYDADYEDRVLDATGWDLNLGGACTLASWFPGVYAGIPASFKTNVELEVDGGATYVAGKEVKPIASVGVLLAPHSFVSFMAGITFMNIPRPQQVDGGGQVMLADSYKAGRTYTFAIGGNVDLATLVLGK